MKYFIDTEFIEGFHKPLLGKYRHFIDLISIGIMAEDGREYYAVSNEFNSKNADKWVYDNVIMNIQVDWVKSYNGDGRNKILDHIEGKGKYGAIRIMQNEIGKSNKQIAEEVFQFCTNDTLTIEKANHYNVVTENIEFYGYYADYDWVLLCSLFGRMIDLPKGFPMYCNDLKQTLDEKAYCWYKQSIKYKTDYCVNNKLFSIEDDIKLLSNYPKQTNEHNALADAKWNYELYTFLKSINE